MVSECAVGRIRLQRTKGWRIPPNTRKVDRSTKFGNPFEVARYGAPEAIRLYRAWLTDELTDGEIVDSYPPLVARHLIARRHTVLASLAELRGMTLACWCLPSSPCHADILLEIANLPEPPPRPVQPPEVVRRAGLLIGIGAPRPARV
jgi:hypothetical protein